SNAINNDYWKRKNQRMLPKRLNAEKAQRLSKLLDLRKTRTLSRSEINELETLMSEADALELEGLQHLANRA
uniref:hypothetical protein n=1 Tax=Candidatus Entotheonella palauensis TaxID=93172 RepID=UPI001C4DED18